MNCKTPSPTASQTGEYTSEGSYSTSGTDSTVMTTDGNGEEYRISCRDDVRESAREEREYESEECEELASKIAVQRDHSYAKENTNERKVERTTRKVTGSRDEPSRSRKVSVTEEGDSNRKANAAKKSSNQKIVPPKIGGSRNRPEVDEDDVFKDCIDGVTAGYNDFIKGFNDMYEDCLKGGPDATDADRKSPGIK